MYDVQGYTRNKWHWYYLLLIWFIVISGFQYMVGSDIPVYMEEYNDLYNELRFDIGQYQGSRQPGWILLCYGCRQITNDFTLLKLIQATFVNIVIFSFFKRQSKYVFCCITLYAMSLYLLINFNIMRQSFSIGFVLLFISYYIEKRYVISVLFLFLAYMFHNSALLALIIPIFGIMRYNRIVFVGLIISFFVLFIVLIRMDIESATDALIKSGLLGDGMSDLSEVYMKSDRLGVRETQIGLVRSLRTLFLLSVIFTYISRFREMYFGGLSLVYLLVLVSSFVFPIMFRFGVYFELPFYIVFSSVIIEFPLGRLKQIRYLFYIFVFMFYSFFPLKEYLSRYPGAPYRYIDQYYPYHSVLNPEVENEIDHNKVNFFRWL